ncbi:MAG TPA: hypothetical protein VHF25_17205 [Nitriliruptorales bacterium]|nr:hypothetical protein [Nitriliruptorales bacterium]
MSRSLAVAGLFTAALLLVDGAGGPPGSPTAVAAEPQHAAGLVIDTGSQVKTVCVRFSETSISGEELLRRASVDAVLADHGSMGAAVCSLCGTGCPAEDCFCEAERSGRYWNYVHAESGGWRRANRGVSSRRVEHGDVDGWAWGTAGSQPPYVGFDSVCGAPAEPSPSAAGSSPPAPAAPVTPTTAGSGDAPAPATTQDAAPPATPEHAAPPASAQDAAPPATTQDAAVGDPVASSPTEAPSADPPVATPRATGGRRAGPASPVGADPTPAGLAAEPAGAGGPALAPLGLFVVVMVGLGALIRRRRRDRPPT